MTKNEMKEAKALLKKMWEFADDTENDVSERMTVLKMLFDLAIRGVDDNEE